jgi:hypothetical protein
MVRKVKAARKVQTGGRAKLSKSLRLRIRRLKAEGRHEEALALWKAANHKGDQ